MRKYSLIGDQNLQLLSRSKNFTNWLYSEIKPYIKGKILEIGSGFGTYSDKITYDFPQNNIFLSDINPKYLESLHQQYFDRPNIKIQKLNLASEIDFKKIKVKFDTISVINVLEHIEDDIQALHNLSLCLNKNRHLILLVPAYKFLFNCIDKEIGHFRRYEKQDIINLLSKTEFKLIKLFYFNAFSILGWYLNGNIFKKPVISKNALYFFDKLVPILKIVEKYVFRKSFGISMIVILQK